MSRLLLITAFLALQWSMPHIHLPEHHDHDGAQHFHESVVHAAHLPPKLPALGFEQPYADFSHQPGDSGVVYVDASFSPAYGKDRLATQSASITLPASWPPPPVAANLNDSLSLFRSFSRQRPPPANNPRAPPASLFS